MCVDGPVVTTDRLSRSGEILVGSNPTLRIAVFKICYNLKSSRFTSCSPKSPLFPLAPLSWPRILDNDIGYPNSCDKESMW